MEHSGRPVQSRLDWLSRLASVPSRYQNAFGLLLVTCFVLISVLSSAGISVTLDEPLHYHYGLFVLQGNTDRIDDSSMPVSALNAFPTHLAASLPDGALKTVLERYFVARLVTVLFSAAVAYLIFRWARSWYGFPASVVATMLYILDPTVLAHSQLVTTDIFAAGMMTVSLFLLWKFAESSKAGDGLLCACAMGLSQLTKYTALALYPIGLLALILHDWHTIRDGFASMGARSLGRTVLRLIAYSFIALATAVLIVNAGFLFNRTLTPLGNYQFQSTTLRSAQQRYPAVAQLPIPLPYPYVQGLDWVQHTNQTGDRFGNVYLLGQLRSGRGFPGYYFVAFALKEPIATQVLVLAALGAYGLSKRRRASFLDREVFLVLPILFFTLYLNFFFNAQTGIRYYLAAFPMLFILAGSLFADWRELPFPVQVSGIVVVACLAISVLSYFPHFIPYFNEFVPDKSQTYKYLSDSNLDWDQSQGDLERFLSQHPDAVYDPTSVQPGLLVVGGSDLVGILTKPQQYAWLRDNFEPVGTIAYTYFVFQVSPEQIDSLCARTTYCQ